MSSDNNKKNPEGTGTITRVINPNTDTLRIDIEAAKASDAILIIIRGTPQGKKFVLNGASAFILGRDKTAEIQLNDPNISRHHARVVFEDDAFFLEDMGSRNGTFINDEKVTSKKIPLSKEDMIRVGTTVLKFLPAGELETLYHTNLTNMAYLDKLTEVYNRNYINEVMEVEFKRARALHTDFSLVLFDIDNFKKVNDTYGHDGGDYVLAELAKTVKNSGLRERDFVGRYGGEEFLVILSSAGLQQAGEVADRIRKNIEAHVFQYEGKKIPITISIGVASLGKEYPSSIDLYKAADKALYESKHNGKNRVTLAKE